VRPSRLLDPADRLRVERAVLEAEARTRGEIVVVVMRAAASYTGVRWGFATWLALLAGLGMAAFVPPAPVLALLGAQVAALALGHAVARIDPVLRWLVGTTQLAEAAGALARAQFAAQGLSRTLGRTGILILVSLLEHRVVVLADEGIHGQLDPGERWQDVVERTLQGLRAGRAADGLVAAVGLCGEILARHLPAGPRNPDELPRALVLED